MCYNTDDLLPICNELNVPIVVRPLLFINSLPLFTSRFVTSSTTTTTGSTCVWLTRPPFSNLNFKQPSVHPVSELIPMINETWIRKGIKPKQHLSSPRPGYENGTVMEKRGHSDRCYTLHAELMLPPVGDQKVSTEVDLMIEVRVGL